MVSPISEEEQWEPVGSDTILEHAPTLLEGFLMGNTSEVLLRVYTVSAISATYPPGPIWRRERVEMKVHVFRRYLRAPVVDGVRTIGPPIGQGKLIYGRFLPHVVVRAGVRSLVFGPELGGSPASVMDLVGTVPVGVVRVAYDASQDRWVEYSIQPGEPAELHIGEGQDSTATTEGQSLSSSSA